MGEFKRSPSKVWWASESLEWREVSESPRSQDSGFSDTESSPTLGIKEKQVQDILKEVAQGSPKNLAKNFREKVTPEKSFKCEKAPTVNRSLFSVKDARESSSPNQYSNRAVSDSARPRRAFEHPRLNRSLPVAVAKDRPVPVLNRSSPAVLLEEDEEVSLNGRNSLASDCESELECLFGDRVESPKHTSTPKAKPEKMRRLRPRERSPCVSPEPLNNDAVQKWMSEIQHHYEQECMTTLQSKSIAGELNQKVAQMATCTTTNIRNILSHAECIHAEYKNLSGGNKHTGPLVQSLAGNVFDFLKNYSKETSPKLTKHYEDIRKGSNEELKLVVQFYASWQKVFEEIVKLEVKKLLEKLENPCSELDLRATVTGVTSLCLRNEHLIDIFIRNNVVPILLILCEKCEGSSMRSLLFRALSTLCCNTTAIRQFEKYSGIHTITETLKEDSSRPEPERSEAVALLAQVTAPWIEDNHSLKDLEDYSRRLSKALTKFITTTKCCQNLLLCTAALANLTTMDPKSIKHLLHLNTAEILLDCVSRRGPCASLYLLEQVATLLANMTSSAVARKQLVKGKAVGALLRFLRVSGSGEDVERRLQQKTIIAISRLCGEKEAAVQAVEQGGVARLVRLCRDKSERFGSDAVLVAALATLRKVTDVCGREVVSTEDVQELVEPKLLDSFLAYSTQSESYV